MQMSGCSDDQQQLPGRRQNWHRDLRDALKHRAAIHCKTSFPCLLYPSEEVRERRLLVPTHLGEQYLKFRLAAVSERGDDHTRCTRRAGILAPDCHIKVSAERRANPI